MPESTPGSSVGTSKLKCGIVFVGAFVIEPSRIASMIPRVSLIAHFHLLNKLFSILCRMKLEECLTEAS